MSCNMPFFGPKESFASRTLQLHLSHTIGDSSQESYDTDLVIMEINEADSECWIYQRQSISKWNYKRSRNEVNNKQRTLIRAAASEFDINLDAIKTLTDALF